MGNEALTKAQSDAVQGFVPNYARDSIDIEVSRERWKQNKKWGKQDHPPSVWVSILGEEFGEVAQAANDACLGLAAPDLQKLSLYRAELIQVAAVAKAMIENLDEQIRVEDECRLG